MTDAKDQIETYVALLRGINVGGKNKLPMKKLVALCEDLGCSNVQTYIQSGNAVFLTTPDEAAHLPARLSSKLAEELDAEIPVVIRSARELEAVINANPFLGEDPDIDITKLHVAFLTDLPKPAAVGTLDPNRSSGDRFRVVGQEIFLHCPNGLARTKLTNAYFDRTLATVATIRNWKTTKKLCEMSYQSGDRID